MEEPTTFQKYIADKLKEDCNEFCNILTNHEVHIKLVRRRIPRCLHNKFLRELEEAGLIKRYNRKKIEIL